MALADLSNKYDVLHDPSVMKAGMDTIHPERKMAAEIVLHHKSGFNGSSSPIKGIRYEGSNTVWYLTTCNDYMVPVTISPSEVGDKGKTKRLNTYPL